MKKFFTYFLASAVFCLMGTVKAMAVDYSHEIYKLDMSTMDLAVTSIPDGWQCMQNGEEIRVPGVAYGSGVRVRAGEGYTKWGGKALYWRSYYAAYGMLDGNKLNLAAGNYQLSIDMAAWKYLNDGVDAPKWKVSILDANGESIKTSDDFEATPNANGSDAADLSTVETKTIEFDVTKAGDYVIKIENATGGDWVEFLLLGCVLKSDTPASAINNIAVESATDAQLYNAAGQKVGKNYKGLVMQKNGKKWMQK